MRLSKEDTIILQTRFLALCKELFGDENGVSEKAYNILADVGVNLLGISSDFFLKVDATDGRYYIPFP